MIPMQFVTIKNKANNPLAYGSDPLAGPLEPSPKATPLLAPQGKKAGVALRSRYKRDFHNTCPTKRVTLALRNVGTELA